MAGSGEQWSALAWRLYETTNLRVGRSNRSGRANKFNDLVKIRLRTFPDFTIVLHPNLQFPFTGRSSGFTDQIVASGLRRLSRDPPADRFIGVHLAPKPNRADQASDHRADKGISNAFLAPPFGAGMWSIRRPKSRCASCATFNAPGRQPDSRVNR